MGSMPAWRKPVDPQVCVANEDEYIYVYIRRYEGAKWFDVRRMNEYVKIGKSHPTWWVEMRISNAKKRFERYIVSESRLPSDRQLRKQARIEAALDQFECRGK